MRVGSSFSLALLFTVLAACGGGEDAAAVPEPPPSVDPAAPGTPPGAPEASPTAAPALAAPAGGPTLADRVAGSTRVVPAPAVTSETAGAFSLVAELCTLDGPEIVGDDTFTTVGPIAWASDGALYLIDQDGRVRRYAITRGEACVLAMDTSFGEGGRMSFGDDAARPRSIAADAAGHVYVSSSMGGTDRLTGSHRDYHCDTRGNVVVSSDGTLGFALFGAGPIRRVSFTDGNCSVEDWRGVELPASVNAVAFVSPSRILVGGSAGSGAPTLARLYAVDGSPTGAAFGDTEGDLSAADHFCWVHGAVACGEGLCVLDGNCRDLRIFGADNVTLGSIDLMRLFGLAYPWVSGLTEFREGVAYTTVSQERDANDVYDGLVFRVRRP